MSSKCEPDVSNVPHCARRDIHCDVLPKCRIEILLPTFSCHRMRRKVMNVPSCRRHKCSHTLRNTSDTAWHKCVSMTAHLSSHSSLSLLFSLSAKGLWTNRVKILSNYCLVRREARFSRWSRWSGWMPEQSISYFWTFWRASWSMKISQVYITHSCHMNSYCLCYTLQHQTGLPASRLNRIRQSQRIVTTSKQNMHAKNVWRQPAMSWLVNTE